MPVNGDAMAGQKSSSMSLSLGPSDSQYLTQVIEELHSIFKTKPTLLMLQRHGDKATENKRL